MGKFWDTYINLGRYSLELSVVVAGALMPSIGEKVFIVGKKGSNGLA